MAGMNVDLVTLGGTNSMAYGLNNAGNAYSEQYFTWYDTEPYHSGIGYVTPQPAHQGLRPQIVEQRQSKKLAQRRRRRVENEKQKTGKQEANNKSSPPPL